MSAFPGGFSVSDLLELDHRDFTFWLNEAEMKKVEDQINAMHAARAAMMGSADFLSEINTLQWRLKLLKKEKDNLK